MRRIVTLSRGNSRRALCGVNEGSAAPAGEPFPAWFYEIRGAVVPTDVGHPLRARFGFNRRRRIFFQSNAAWFVRFLARIFIGHIDFLLAWTRAPLVELARPGQEAQGMEPCPSANLNCLGVVQRAATPAGEPSPAWVDIVPGAVIEACVKQLSRTTARFPGISAFFRAAAALITGLLACFFVSHN